MNCSTSQSQQQINSPSTGFLLWKVAEKIAGSESEGEGEGKGRRVWLEGFKVEQVDFASEAVDEKRLGKLKELEMMSEAGVGTVGQDGER